MTPVLTEHHYMILLQCEIRHCKWGHSAIEDSGKENFHATFRSPWTETKAHLSVAKQMMEGNPHCKPSGES